MNGALTGMPKRGIQQIHRRFVIREMGDLAPRPPNPQTESNCTIAAIDPWDLVYLCASAGGVDQEGFRSFSRRFSIHRRGVLRVG